MWITQGYPKYFSRGSVCWGWGWNKYPGLPQSFESRHSSRLALGSLGSHVWRPLSPSATYWSMEEKRWSLEHKPQASCTFSFHRPLLFSSLRPTPACSVLVPLPGQQYSSSTSMSAHHSSDWSHPWTGPALLSASMKWLPLAGSLCAPVPCFATLCSVKPGYVDNNQEKFILLLFHHLE